jgi:2-dehydro-3-deoxygalactonokinase
MDQAEWFAVDWGTTHLRVWVFGPDERLLTCLTSDKGMSKLKPHDFEPVLLDLVASYLGQGVCPVIACGMVGARQGWAEAPYLSVPSLPPTGETGLRVTPTDARIDLHILPGLSQKKPADVMRGEETQIAGYLARDPNFFGTLCLPGTHTKWVQVSAKEIVSFRTFMTGELFSLISGHSVLRHGIGAGGWLEPDFLEAVDDAMTSPQQVTSRLFGLRAEGLINNLSAEATRARLSGYLIGLELAGAKPYWLGQDLVVIGAPDLSALYARALAVQGLPSRVQSGDDMTLDGLKAAYHALKEARG